MERLRLYDVFEVAACGEPDVPLHRVTDLWRGIDVAERFLGPSCEGLALMFRHRRQWDDQGARVDPPQRYGPVATSSVDKFEAFTTPPRLIRVQTRTPTDTDPGAIAECSYTIQVTAPNAGVLTVADDAGAVIGRMAIRAQDDAGAAARKLVLKQKGESAFWRRLS